MPPNPLAEDLNPPQPADADVAVMADVEKGTREPAEFQPAEYINESDNDSRCARVTASNARARLDLGARRRVRVTSTLARVSNSVR